MQWLKQREIQVDRYNLAQQPMSFVQNEKAKAFLEASGAEGLPLLLLDGETVMAGVIRNAELARWFGIPLEKVGLASKSCCGGNLLVAEMSGGHMKFLQNIPPYLFFTGKGGVGKTSISCATAISLAEQGKRVLLVSTDPASNVGQVFSQTIGNTILPVASVPGLSALEIDPQAAAQQYRARIVDPIKGILPDDVVNSINEQLSGACTTEIAFDEFTGLLTDASLLTRFDHIIFDTAPTGHTIRLLQLPGAWSSFIESNPDGASCLGPMAGLEKQREQYSHAVQALSDPDRTRLVFGSTAKINASGSRPYS
jgi:hypothetical protein